MTVFHPQIASLFKTLADENRLKIILVLTGAKKTVSKIVDETGLSQPLVSHHLRELKNKHVIKTEREGSFVFNELAEPAIVGLIKLTNQLVLELHARGNAFTLEENEQKFIFPEIMKVMFEMLNQQNKEK